jgi:hypothetical protein
MLLFGHYAQLFGIDDNKLKLYFLNLGKLNKFMIVNAIKIKEKNLLIFYLNN